MSTTERVERFWEDDVLPALAEFISIPAVSPLFDPEWRENGHIRAAVDHAADYCRGFGAAVEILELPGCSPLLFAELPGNWGTVLAYGHLDKQPAFTGWREGLGPWQPSREGDLLYGRGAVDDGYALFTALAAWMVLPESERPTIRFMIECGEESGSPDLPAYLDLLAPRLENVDLVVVLDSGCHDYERMWLTTSLRGLLGGVLRVQVLDEGVHSGSAGGIVPSSFRVLRDLLSRLEEPGSGCILPDFLQAEVPDDRLRQIHAAGEVLGVSVAGEFPWRGGTRALAERAEELLLNRSWRASLAVTGVAGMPAIHDAGNVLRPETAVKLALRLPPTVNAAEAGPRLKELLEANPPHGAEVSFDITDMAQGWSAVPLPEWLEDSVERACSAHFGHPPVLLGQGVSIPVVAMLGRRLPYTPFLVTGALGPGSNAHGPNESLHLPTAKKITAVLAHAMAALARRA